MYNTSMYNFCKFADMKRRLPILMLLALMVSCSGLSDSPQPYVVPEFTSVSSDVSGDESAPETRLTAKLNSSHGVERAGFMIGLSETTMKYCPALLSGLTFSLTLDSMEEGRYAYCATAGNSRNEIRSAIDWFTISKSSSSIPDSGDDDPTEPLPPPGADGITISDENFRDSLLLHFDTDRNGKLELSEALAIENISVTTTRISTLDGVQYMSNLKKIRCSGTPDTRSRLTKLDFRYNPRLEALECNFSRVEQISIPSSTKELRCRYGFLQQITFPSGSCLKNLDVFGNRLTALDVSALAELEYLECGLNSFSTLDVSGNLKLKVLDLRGSAELEVVYLSKGQEIETIYADDGVSFRYKDR